MKKNIVQGSAGEFGLLTRSNPDMKKQLTGLLTQMSKEEFENLSGIVNKTIATGSDYPPGKNFTAGDLWNIHKRKKARRY